MVNRRNPRDPQPNPGPGGSAETLNFCRCTGVMVRPGHIRLRRRNRPGLAAVLAGMLLASGCGRIGYEAVDLVTETDGGASMPPPDARTDTLAPGMDAADAGESSDAAADVGSDAGVDVAPVDVGSDARVDVAPADVGADVRVDVPPAADAPLPPDARLDSAVDTAFGCRQPPAPSDWIAHFEDGTATTVIVGGRGGTPFSVLRESGTPVTLEVVAIGDFCGSRRALRFAAPGGANESRMIQVYFLRGVDGRTPSYDGRAYDGIRISHRSWGHRWSCE